MDVYLALRAREIASRYDIVLAHSEKVGIPLSFLGLQTPLVVVTHHMESPIKARMVRAAGIVKRWAGVGYVSNESKQFISSYYGVSEDRLCEWESAKHLSKAGPLEMVSDGPIVSVGVAKRDYGTLVRALKDLAGYETELFVSSKFGDRWARKGGLETPQWVHVMGYVSDDELSQRYRRARFVVVPLERTTQNSAGVNAVFEAGAYGKAVIASRAGGMPSFVKDQETGILVPPYDTQALRDAIQHLWEHPDLARQMGLAGRRFVEGRYSPDAANARINRFLEKVYRGTQ